MVQIMYHKTKNNKIKWYHDFAGTLYTHKNKKNFAEYAYNNATNS